MAVRRQKIIKKLFHGEQIEITNGSEVITVGVRRVQSNSRVVVAVGMPHTWHEIRKRLSD